MIMLQAGMILLVLLLAIKRAVVGPQKVFARASLVLLILGVIFTVGIGAKQDDAFVVVGCAVILLGLSLLLVALLTHFSWMIKQRFPN